jgi:hypothetical protein
MDNGELIGQAVAYAAGLLGKAAGKTADKLGGAIGTKLLSLLRRDPKTRDALDDLGAEPGDPDLQAALRVQLKKALREDDALREELAAIMEEAVQAGWRVTQTATVTGDANTVIQAGRDVKR